MPVIFVLSFILTESAGEMAGLSIAATYYAVWTAFLAVFAGVAYWAWRHPVGEDGEAPAAPHFCLDPEH